MKKSFVAASFLIISGCNSGSPGGEPPHGSPSPSPHPTDDVPQPVLRFVAVGDTGTGLADAYDVAAAIGRKCDESGCDFIALLGDNVYPAGVSSLDDPQWETKVRIPYVSLGVPLRPILGNHDYGESIPDPIRADVQVAYSDVEPLWEMPARYYARGSAPAHLFFLDTSPIGYESTAATEQLEYFRPILNGSASPWRIAFGHRPLFSSGADHGSAEHAEAEFLRAVLCDRVDVYFSGHDHVLAVLPPPADCPVTQVVSGAGAMAEAIDEDVPALFSAAELGFAYVVLSGDALYIEMVGIDGSVRFATTLRH